MIMKFVVQAMAEPDTVSARRLLFAYMAAQADDMGLCSKLGVLLQKPITPVDYLAILSTSCKAQVLDYKPTWPAVCTSYDPSRYSTHLSPPDDWLEPKQGRTDAPLDAVQLLASGGGGVDFNRRQDRFSSRLPLSQAVMASRFV